MSALLGLWPKQREQGLSWPSYFRRESRKQKAAGKTKRCWTGLLGDPRGPRRWVAVRVAKATLTRPFLTPPGPKSCGGKWAARLDSPRWRGGGSWDSGDPRGSPMVGNPGGGGVLDPRYALTVSKCAARSTAGPLPGRHTRCPRKRKNAKKSHEFKPKIKHPNKTRLGYFFSRCRYLKLQSVKNSNNSKWFKKRKTHMIYKCKYVQNIGHHNDYVCRWFATM